MGWIRRIAETMWPHLSEEGWRRQMLYEELINAGSASSMELLEKMGQHHPQLYRYGRAYNRDFVEVDLIVLESEGRARKTGTIYEVIQ